MIVHSYPLENTFARTMKIHCKTLSPPASHTLQDLKPSCRHLQLHLQPSKGRVVHKPIFGGSLRRVAVMAILGIRSQTESTPIMATQAFSSMMAFIKGFFSDLLLASNTPAILAQLPACAGLAKLRARKLFLLPYLEQPYIILGFRSLKWHANYT